MLWVEGITRADTKLAVLKVDAAGRRSNCPLDTLKELPEQGGRCQKSKFDTNFQTWEPTGPADYARGIGMQHPISNAHRVFRLTDRDTTYLIPAQVLFKAVFRPLGTLALNLFRPQGLEQTCVPKHTDAGVSFVMTGLSQRTQSCTSLQRPLSWMWSFPSARRMWESVYRYACSGELACDLPIGKARIVVTGVKKDGLFLVTEMTVLQVTTDEIPFEFARNHLSTIIFHEGVSFRMRQLSDFVARPDSNIAQRNGQWDLSDSEWSAIYPLFEEQQKRGNAKRKHELRSLLDGILAKLGTGIPWTKFQFLAGTWSNASKLYGECRKDGRWEEILGILERSRGMPR